MQFYDFFKELVDYIPSQYGFIRGFAMVMMPYLLMACALFTSFFALKCGKWWCALTFFWLGGTVSARYLLTTRDPYELRFWVMLGVCISIAVFAAYLSKYLFRAQLVISNFTLVYASLPAFLFYLGDIPARIVSAIVAAAMAFLTVKYKYIIIIVTTSFSGSFIFWDMAESMYGVKYKIVWAVLMGIVALAYQIMMNADALIDTYLDVTDKVERTERGGKRLVEHVTHHHSDDTAESTKTEETESTVEELAVKAEEPNV